MRKEEKELDIIDLPSIRLKEGRFILGVGIPVWREKWLRVFQYKVKHWKTTKCTLLNLESLVEVVYPEAVDDHALRVRIVHDYMWRLIEERRRITKERALAKNKDGEGAK